MSKAQFRVTRMSGGERGWQLINGGHVLAQAYYTGWTREATLATIEEVRAIVRDAEVVEVEA